MPLDPLSFLPTMMGGAFVGPPFDTNPWVCALRINYRIIIVYRVVVAHRTMILYHIIARTSPSPPPLNTMEKKKRKEKKVSGLT